LDLQLKGRPALVTGASRGIGRGAAKILAAEGCKVAICARRKELLEEVAAEIEADGHDRPLIINEDVLPLDAPEKISVQVIDAFGGCDILVNSAGGSRTVPWDSGDDVWDEGMTLNFEAIRRLSMALVHQMREQKYGRIINITGSSEPKGVNVANAAKAALHVWSKGMSRTLGRDGITVNCLPPGRIMSEQIVERVHPDPQERAAFADTHIPAGYFGEPEDMGHLIAFLASPLARYINGEIIHVDGGLRRFAF
jgi:3-oxoacyl-[acyl-carrier protein] reductase